MDIYLTFYNILTPNGHKELCINNGFSFFDRGKDKNYIDLYFDSHTPSSFIEKEISKHKSIDTIYCSLSLYEDFELIRPILTDKWVLGGPYVSTLIANGIDSVLPGKCIEGCYEKHQGQESLNCQFDPYFSDWAQTQTQYVGVFNCSIGKGCYWSKCKFCAYRFYDSKGKTDGKIISRPNIGDIVEQLQPLPGIENTLVHLCTPAIPPKALRQILESKRDKQIQLNVFARADDIILDVIGDYEDPTVCQNLQFVIGCESLSQFAIDKLNKGTTVENTIEMTKLVLERGGRIAHGLMDHYVFANRRMVTETLDSLKKLKEISCRYPKHQVMFFNNGVTRWPTKEAVCEFADDYDTYIDYGLKTYVANIPENSDAFDCNKQISLALKNSGIPNIGEPYQSLR